MLPTAVGVVGRLGGNGGKLSSMIFEVSESLKAVSTDILLESDPPGSGRPARSGGSVSSRRTPKKDRGSSCSRDLDVPSPGSFSYSEIRSSSSSGVFRPCEKNQHPQESTEPV